jgi:hypothetical protein
VSAKNFTAPEAKISVRTDSSGEGFYRAGELIIPDILVHSNAKIFSPSLLSKLAG